MTKALAMVSHKNHNLSANEGFGNIFDSQVVYMLYWQFHYEKKSQSIVYLLDGSEHIYWILDLQDKVYSVWDLWTHDLQESKGNDFFAVGRSKSIFGRVQKIQVVAPTQIYLPCKLVEGGGGFHTP